MNNKLPKTISAAIMTAALLCSSLTAASFQTFADFHVQKTVYISNTAKSQSSGFYVDGTTIRDANGNAFVMRGVNIAHAWYKDQTETSIKAAASLGTNVVRIVCADGVQWEKTSADELKNIIKICRENNQVCILEVHDATGRDSTDDLLKAVDYWIEMKDILDENQKYVILNIANEWFGTWDGSAWAEGCKTAVKKVRDAGIRNMIMIDCAGWGQYPDSVKDYGKSVFQADPDKNTVFSVHMYEYAGGNAEMVKNNIDNTLGIGVPVVIGEFGGQHTDGDVDEATIMQYCTEKGAGYLGWSWKGNNSDLAFLDIAESWDGSSLTEWGKALIYGDYGIQKTSEICSVFGSKPEQTTEATEGVQESTEETTEKATAQKYQIAANSGDEIQVVLKGTPNASANGCFGYKDTSGEWISDEWSVSFDSDGKAVVNYTVPADVNGLEFQIWWSGLWNDSTQSNDDASAELVDYIIISSDTETAETETETVSAAKTLYGDTDENGKIDILDVITLNRAILGKEKLSAQAEINADVNRSGKPDATDSLMIMKYIVGLIADFSI